MGCDWRTVSVVTWRRTLCRGSWLVGLVLLLAPLALVPETAIAGSLSAGPTVGTATRQADAQKPKLNLNTATSDEFRTIPGVGSAMVREFEEYRPYVSIKQFRLEIGKYVSADQVAAYEQYVVVPVDPNKADADTLMQIPGVDASIAADLIAGRPYASGDAFQDKLSAYLTADQVAASGSYLATP